MAKKKNKSSLKKKITRHRINKFKDSDADGLPDILEKIIGTDPKKADSDHDGVNDYEEVNIYQTDPLNSDTDGDGVKDGEEIKRGLNPRGPGLLKDLFIPHAGNDFQPKALRPYRLLFYALSSIVLKTILIGAVIILPIEAWLTPDILAEQNRKIISLTNLIRKNLSLAPLAESQRLDQAAYDKAEDMLLNQYFSHTGPDSKTLASWLNKIKYDYAVAGENLAIGFSSPEEVVNGWSRSQTHYQNMIDSDFKEIGVGTVSGLYANTDTTLVAQYFGAPRIQSVPVDIIKEPPLNPEIKKLIELVNAGSGSAQLLGKKVDVPPAKPIEPLDTAPPEMDQAKSKLYVDQPEGQSEKIIRAEVYLSPDAVKARVVFSNYFINLRPAAGEPAEWIGQAIIFKQDQEQVFNPVILASVTAEDQAGNKATVDLDWDNIKPANTTALEQYFFIKQHQPSYIQPLFDVTSIFYKMILIIALIALALNILIKIKRQYPGLILSTLGLIGLLAVLIIV